jgi:hypothetical protein
MCVEPLPATETNPGFLCNILTVPSPTTPQEGAEISQGSIATYGTYTFADKTVMKGSGLLSGPSGPATKAPY